MDQRWKIKIIDDLKSEKLANDLGVKNIISRLLVSRDVLTYSEAERFFRPKISDLHDPYLMKGMGEAVNRIDLALKRKEKILIYGDYDVDGTTSVAMMYSFLKRFTENIGYYIPDRYKEGYGVSFTAIDYAQLNEYSLIITLDCGIRAIRQVEYASNKGIDFIICDHHQPGVNLPMAISILNPKQDQCVYPYKELSGCGVGFKLIQAFANKKNINFTEIAEYMDLLSVSIGADIVDMNGENRVFAFYGLRIINSAPRAGLKALIKNSNNKGHMSMSDVVFKIAPRINAAGRIEHGSKAVRLLIEEDFDKAFMIAAQIENYNFQRRQLDTKITEEAIKMIDRNKMSTVVFSDGWHKGVIGIVASRLIEHEYKPTIVLCQDNEYLTGSARSVKGFDLYSALLDCEHLLERFGGHKYAAGLTLKKENLNLFITEFEKIVADRITSDQLQSEIEIDIEIDISQVTDKIYRIIKQFEPFGPKNRKPIFVTRGIKEFVDAKLVGSDQNHLKLVLRSDDKKISCIGFGMQNEYKQILNATSFDICYSIDENKWNNNTELQLRLKGVKAF